jgi:hypothetical protein
VGKNGLPNSELEFVKQVWDKHGKEVETKLKQLG